MFPYIFSCTDRGIKSPALLELEPVVVHPGLLDFDTSLYKRRDEPRHSTEVYTIMGKWGSRHRTQIKREKKRKG